MTEPTRPPTKADLQLRAVQLAAIRNTAAAELTHIKAALTTMMEPGDSSHPVIPTGDPKPPIAGAVTYRHGGSSVLVTDETKFREWVDENYPGEVEMIERVRPAFQGRFVDANGVVVGPGGEIDVPGIGVVTGAPSLSVAPDKKTADQLWLSMRGRTLLELIEAAGDE